MAGSGTAALHDDALLQVRNLRQEFPIKGGVLGRQVGAVHAVSDVSFDVLPGETLGLVGESGCGKSTVLKSILQVPRPNDGHVVFEGHDLTQLSGRELSKVRRRMQMVFQDPYSSLNPAWRIRALVGEPLRGSALSAEQRRARVDELLELVGLDPAVHGERRPHELSGGQCQRVVIARALAAEPTVLLCDEAVSALDVSVQAQVLNLFESLRRELSLTYVFISHDLSVVRHVSDRVGVMYLGKLCEIGPSEDLYRDPVHPYTAALLSSVPQPDPAAQRPVRVRLEGDLPSPADPPSGCRFRTRCPRAQELCAQQEPVLVPFGPEHFAACHFPLREPGQPPLAAVPRHAELRTGDSGEREQVSQDQGNDDRGDIHA